MTSQSGFLILQCMLAIWLWRGYLKIFFDTPCEHSHLRLLHRSETLFGDKRGCSEWFNATLAQLFSLSRFRKSLHSENHLHVIQCINNLASGQTFGCDEFGQLFSQQKHPLFDAFRRSECWTDYDRGLFYLFFCMFFTQVLASFRQCLLPEVSSHGREVSLHRLKQKIIVSS